MKTLKFFASLFCLVLLSSLITVQAQTKQAFLYGTVDGEYVACLNKQVWGEWTYHITYHVDKKTGIIKNLHWNVVSSDLVDGDGIRYILVDTGNDNMGALLDIYNNLNYYNEVWGAPNISYYPDDGYMEGIISDPADEGSIVAMAFKFVGGGKVFKWSSLFHVTINANGELTAEVVKEDASTCNEL